MNKTKLAVFCCLVLAAIMYEMNVDAAGGYGSRKQSDTSYQGKRSADRSWRGKKQQEGARSKRGDTPQQASTKANAAKPTSSYDEYE